MDSREYDCMSYKYLQWVPYHVHNKFGCILIQTMERKKEHEVFEKVYVTYTSSGKKDKK